MAKITRFEDLDCWKSARELVKMVYTFSSVGLLSKDFDTKSQIRKAALSSMNNIAEGFARYHKKDSLRFYDFAQSSAAEVKSMSYVLEDLNYLNIDELKSLREKTEDTRNLTLGFIRYLDRNSNT